MLDALFLRPCPAWKRKASTCESAFLPHADKHIFLYVLELGKSEAKRSVSNQRKVEDWFFTELLVRLRNGAVGSAENNKREGMC
jgi:hypothetical protein